MKAIAHDFTSWQFMERDIENSTSVFMLSTKRQISPIVESVPWSAPTSLWSRIYIDYNGSINDPFYLALVDAYFKSP